METLGKGSETRDEAKYINPPICIYANKILHERGALLRYKS